MKSFAGIDFLRGIAALSVVIYHIFVILGFTQNNIFPYIHHFALFGVSIFFIISGFLVYASFLNTYNRTNSKVLSLKYYFISRVFRIVPAYIFSLFVCLLLYALNSDSSWFYSGNFFRHLLENVFFISYFTNKIAGFGYNGVYWTLNVEMLWYLLVPLLILYLHKIRYIYIGIFI